MSVRIIPLQQNTKGRKKERKKEKKSLLEILPLLEFATNYSLLQDGGSSVGARGLICITFVKIFP